MQQALGALQNLYGPNFRLEDILQGVQGLRVRPQSPSAIHTVEPETAEAEQHPDDEGLWNRDLSGRLQRVQRGQTGGSEGGSDQHF